MADKFITLNESTGGLEQKSPVTASAGSADAGKIPALGGDGLLDASMLPDTGGGDGGRLMPTTEALAAGDFVNVHLDGGTSKLRKADATSYALRAHGFVKESAASGASVKFYDCGVVTGLSGLAVGATYFLAASNPGKSATTVPSTTGHIVQALGFAISATEIQTNISGIPVTRA